MMISRAIDSRARIEFFISPFDAILQAGTLHKVHIVYNVIYQQVATTTMWPPHQPTTQ
jgi:hypothetical protein